MQKWFCLMVLIAQHIPSRSAHDPRMPAALMRMLPTPEESRQHLIDLGVSSHRLPTDEHIDWVGLVCTLDRLFSTGCGHAGIQWFLKNPDSDLGGHSPEDVLDEPGGVNRVRRLVARELALVT